MCGIFAVVRDEPDRAAPTAATVDGALDEAIAVLDGGDALPQALRKATAGLTALDTLLKGAPGVRCLVGDGDLCERVAAKVQRVRSAVERAEAAVEAGAVEGGPSVEEVNSALQPMKDVVWAIERDRLRTAREVCDLLADSEPTPSAIDAYTTIQLSLSALDRLEVRGRDSAGISVIVSSHGLPAEEVDQRIADRRDPLLRSLAVERSERSVVFVYKAAAEIGALGDNVRYLRAAVRQDGLLRELVTRPGATASVVAHTRWASVGTVSEPNAHPVDSQEVPASHAPCVLASLNGDVDNYAELKLAEGLHVSEEQTTDAKVIPVLVARRLAEGLEPMEALRRTVERFEGSVAIAVAVPSLPDRLYLAVHGSGQGCYIGLAERSFLVASEPYGVVEECDRYLRLDGESTSAASGRQGQIVELRRDGAGTIAGIRRLSYGGEELPIDEDELVAPEVTTRDIDRRGAPHFLLKELMESPESVRRTLRGKVVDAGGRLSVALGDDVLPRSVAAGLTSGAIRHVTVIGQGTAAVAGRSLASLLSSFAPAGLSVDARVATELSGFGLRDDMSDALVVAVSQSGTTTDTNRTVDLVRSRGAKVIAIVNRRQSDLTEKADGVLFTSDGRDVEMSVASTKAFYSQVTACSMLAIAIADAVGCGDRQDKQDVLRALRRMPDAMREVLAKRPQLAAAAQELAPRRRSWAIVGSGPDHIAAQELRIKMSELCYKSIACDVTEDKKHIDLSAEPLIFVCASGLSGANAADVAKEVAIYRAHKAAPIVITSEAAGVATAGACASVTVPSVHPQLDFMLSAVAGHLFGYEAALAIDGQGRLMRSARAVLDDVLASDIADDRLVANLRSELAAPAQAIFDALRSGQLNGHLEPSTAVRVANLLRFAMGVYPVEALEVELGGPLSPRAVAAELLAALSSAVDELSRPIDAVKHQAKTVTVGISRTEETFAESPLVAEVVAAGTPRERLSYRSMRTLAALDDAVTEVVGFTRYQVEGEVGEGTATIAVVGRGGVAEGITSRSESDPRLMGTKHRAAYERMVTVGRGQRDGRTVVIVPEVGDQVVVGITLLHVRMAERLPAATARSVLTGYRNRYSALVDAVMETELDFDDSLLATVDLVDLLVEPVWVLAAHWRRAG